MKQKISRHSLRSPNNVHTSSSKLYMAIQFQTFTQCWNRFVEMQNWTDVLFNSGIHVLVKGERAQKITHSLVIPFEYKYIWRDRNTSYSKMRGRYDRVRCPDNFNHKKVNTLKIMWRFLQENFDDFRGKILTIFLWRVDYVLQKNFTIFAEKFNNFWQKI